MSYNEWFEKFRKGELPAAEKEDIEKDIEKQRVIGDYLEEEMDERLFEGEERKEKDGDADMAKLIGKAVSRKLRKYSVCAGTIVLAIATFLIFGLSPLVDMMYFNPGKELTGTDIYNALDVPLSVYTELRCAEKKFFKTHVEAQGYGKYSVKLQLFQDRGNIVPETYYLTMDKGRFTEENSGWQNNYPETNFQNVGLSGEREAHADWDDIAELEKLPETAVVTACFCFKDDEDLSFLKELDSTGSHITYVPIRVSDESSAVSGLYFGYAPKSTVYQFNPELADLGRYPALFPSWISMYPSEISAEDWGTHFKSMLKYMADQKDLNYALGDDPDTYTKALDYVEKNGVKAFGAVVSAPVDELLRMRQNEKVVTMFVVDVKLYEFYRKDSPNVA